MISGLLDIVGKSVKICVSEHETIDPPQVWQLGQRHIWIGEFYCTGGVRKPVSIWCEHQCTTSSHWAGQVVDCGLWNIGPLFDGRAPLLEELEHAVVDADPEHPKHAECPGVCWPCKNWDVCSLQESCTAPFNMGPFIILLPPDPQPLTCTTAYWLSGICQYRKPGSFLSRGPDAMESPAVR